jgi:uncharacterized protein
MGWWLAYLAMGLGVGVFAGMLGIGGGTMLVTLMVFAFGAQGFPTDCVLHLALGTAMATIIPTSIASFRAHHKHEAVRWDIVRAAAPGLILGAIAGTLIANDLPSKDLALVFVAFAYCAGAQMILDVKPKAAWQIPGPRVVGIVGALVGTLCALVGAAGGIITIPLMTMFNVPMRHAIGTSAAFGLPVAMAGTAGYVWSELSAKHLPSQALGYVFVPALIAVVLGTALTVPAGARLAHRMPVAALKRIFGIILWILATKMLWTFI